MEKLLGPDSEVVIKLSGRTDINIGLLCFWGIEEGSFARNDDANTQAANRLQARKIRTDLLNEKWNSLQYTLWNHDAELIEQALPEMLEAHMAINGHEHSSENFSNANQPVVQAIQRAIEELR